MGNALGMLGEAWGGLFYTRSRSLGGLSTEKASEAWGGYRKACLRLALGWLEFVSGESSCSPSLPRPPEAFPSNPQAPAAFPSLPEAFPKHSPSLPQASPNLLEAFPSIPQAPPSLPEAFPSIPQAFPSLPKLSQRGRVWIEQASQVSPSLPEHSPTIPQTFPKPTQAFPSLPKPPRSIMYQSLLCKTAHP